MAINQSEILDAAISNVWEKGSLEERVKQFGCEESEHLTDRLFEWLEFLNTHESKQPILFEPLVFGILDCISSNEICREQNEQEFTKSLELVKAIFHSNILLKFQGVNEVKLLYSIIFYYGNAQSETVQPIQSALSKIHNGYRYINNESLIRFFEFLFVKYETPLFLVKYLDKLSTYEFDLLRFIISGKNIRHFLNLPIKVSKKESYILQNSIPENLVFENSILKRNIIVAKILLHYPFSENLYHFLDKSKLFKYNVDRFLKDINFWSSAYTLLMYHDTGHLSTIEYLDYLEYMKCHVNAEYSLKGRNLNSLTINIIELNEKGRYSQILKYREASWKHCEIPDTMIELGGVRYTVTQLVNGLSLYEEGLSMRHCAFSYIEYCMDNSTTIWSIRKEENSVFKRHLTIEVTDRVLTQASGPCNSELTKADEALVKRWCEANEVEC